MSATHNAIRQALARLYNEMVDANPTNTEPLNFILHTLETVYPPKVTNKLVQFGLGAELWATKDTNVVTIYRAGIPAVFLTYKQLKDLVNWCETEPVGVEVVIDPASQVTLKPLPNSFSDIQEK